MAVRRDEGNVVVLGAGIAGLLAAHVLADHYPQVLLVDRDVLPAGSSRRSGVPQGSHIHGLFNRGLRAVEELLPGFGAELLRRGGTHLDAARDLALASPFGWGVRFPSRLDVIGASRPLMEDVIVGRLLERSGVRLLSGHQAQELSGTPQRVTGVVLREVATGDTRTEQAELVVDATGRGSRLPHWLAQLGCPAPPETVVDAHLGYATRMFRPPADHRADWLACYALPCGPETTRGGALAPIEDGQWIVTLSGVGDHRPSQDPEAFLPFARSLSTGLIADAIEGATPLGAVARSNSTANRRRHLERTTPLPDNLLVVGDAACTFNPVYAQGMTVAALSALLLRDQLTGGRPGARRFHRRLARLQDIPWQLAVNSDQRYPTTDGPSPTLAQRALGPYLDRVLAAGTRHRAPQEAFLRVLNMTAHPVSLFAPSVLGRALTPRRPSKAVLRDGDVVG